MLKSLRKLDKYYPNEKKYLYRCINFKANLNYDLYNKKLVPYIPGNAKTFWGFTSSSPDIAMTYNFLKGEGNNKSGTIFTLAGKIWGYDISLFNYYKEEEILIEPERKFKIDEVIPPVNDIIHIRCDIQDSPLILDDELINKTIQKNNIDENNNTRKLEYDYRLKCVMVGDFESKKTKIAKYLQRLERYDNFLNMEPSLGYQFIPKYIKIRNKLYYIEIWQTIGKENYRFFNRIFMRNAVCYIIVYSITNRITFSHIPDWINECKAITPKALIVLVGNESHKEDKREVTREEGELLAEKYELQFFEVSAKTGLFLYDTSLSLFYRITEEVSKRIDEGFYFLNDRNVYPGEVKIQPGVIKLQEGYFKKKKDCC